ncbi:MAG: alanine racemase [Candidatus Cloacimonetes bacterium]|nr:alanine racemase [Candidatus Cloacimonadota bacterium]
MEQTSYIELNSSALQKNLAYLKKMIGPETKFVSVIKGNAYGHGISAFLPLAEQFGIDYFAVFDAYEASIALKAKQQQTELMIMGMIDNDQLEWAIENNISFYVFEKDRLIAAINSAKKIKKPARIHLELETGMYRTGFEEAELDQVIALIKGNKKHLFIEGLCTHYAGAESIANHVRVENQYQEFLRLRNKLTKKGIKARYEHTACSAATLTYPHTKMNLVRIGIAHYGYWPSQETRMHNLFSDRGKYSRDPLRKVLQWKTKVMSTKVVEAGKFISYGHTFMAAKKTTIAAIPIGYYHGYRRSLSNIGHVLIRGKKAPIIGLVNMNMFVVDVSAIPGVSKGDEVVIIGDQGAHRITVSSFCELTNLVNYELLCRLPVNIPRLVIS